MTPAESARQPANIPQVDTVVQGNNAFALDLYHTLRAAEGNLFFAPYSIASALAMTYAGTRGNTALQMARTLHFTLSPEELHPAFAALAADLVRAGDPAQVNLQVANALWPQIGYPLLAPFMATLETNYGTAVTAVDYRSSEAARQRINHWVEDQTQQRIRELIPPGVLTSLTRLVLTNAIYFKGQWASQFDPALTAPAPFHVMPESTITMPMMAKKQTAGYAEFDGLQLLELPYTGDEVAMVILLPRRVDGLAELEATLTAEQLARWLGAMRRREVEVFLPRYSVSQGLRLDQALRALGMTDAFDPDRADLSGMDGNRHWLYIAAVLHKAFVDVNEEGTAAAAATAVVVAMRALPKPPPVVRADHPFLFLIRARRSGSILFLGRVVNPLVDAD
jgi:serine protease inhibitor